MHVERVAHVAAHRHRRKGNFAGKPTLTVAKRRPRGAVEAGELHEEKRQTRAVPVGAPRVDEQRKESLVHLDVVRVRLALIPNYTAYRKFLQWLDARLIKVRRGVGMTGLRMGAALGVLA